MHVPPQAVSNATGAQVQWFEDNDEPDKGCVYVLESFDSPLYKKLLGNCRCLYTAVLSVYMI